MFKQTRDLCIKLEIINKLRSPRLISFPEFCTASTGVLWYLRTPCCAVETCPIRG